LFWIRLFFPDRLRGEQIAAELSGRSASAITNGSRPFISMLRRLDVAEVEHASSDDALEMLFLDKRNRVCPS
jgi:hypothetical protein